VNTPKTPIGDAALPIFPVFIRQMLDRLREGRENYGDDSFRRRPSEIAGEIEQELLDVVGWGFLLWFQLHQLRAKLEQLEEVVS
jgi:hypothetical protein